MTAAVAALVGLCGTQPAVAQTEDPDIMYMPEEVTLNENNEAEVEVYLNTTETEYNAFEMNIYLPSNIEIMKNSRGKYMFTFNTPDVIYDHSAAVEKYPDYYRAVCCSLSSSFIAPGDNLIFTFRIKALEPFTEPLEAHIQDIMYASGVTAETAKGHFMEPCYFTIKPYNVSTGIEDVATESDDETIYTLEGLSVKRPLMPGVYIINGKKVLVR